MKRTSASPNRLAEDVVILPVVVSELEFRNVERQVFSAHLVERAHDAALDERPETINGLSVDGADNVLADSVVNSRVREFPGQLPVAVELVCAKQADFGRDGLADEIGEGRSANILNDASDDIALFG